MICAIIYDVGTINMRFYLLEVPYSYEYCRINLISFIYYLNLIYIYKIVPTSH